MTLQKTNNTIKLRDFHLSDDEKEIGSYAGWISKFE